MTVDPSNISLCGKVQRLVLFDKPLYGASILDIDVVQRIGGSNIIAAMYLSVDLGESNNPSCFNLDRVAWQDNKPMYTILISDDHPLTAIHLKLLKLGDQICVKCVLSETQAVKFFSEENVLLCQKVISSLLSGSESGD